MSEDSVIEAQLPLESVGARLMRAREASGMSRAQMAELTKIPERHLAEIEANNFGALPARTYAVGFSRSYAKALGLNDQEIVDAVRAELGQIEPAPVRGLPAFEPGDPARVPGSRFAWFAALAALLVVIGGFAFAWRSYYSPAGTLPSALPAETSAPAAAASQAPAPAAAPTGGPVVFTAMAPKVWVKFYDGTGKQLMQKEMAQGETWTVPQDVADVKLWTANPQALAITVGGKTVPKLSEIQQTLKDVPVTAAALLARGQGGVAAAPQAAASQPAPGTAQTAIPAPSVAVPAPSAT
ncbi:MAG: DUF4115 domain-containing protein [Proteobacteria bacterium]|nr:DUF4115 domain-containing protein [Pseudomonadota bacterium]